MREWFSRVKDALFGKLTTYDVEYWDGRELRVIQLDARNWWEASKVAEDAGIEPFYINEAKKE